MLQIDIGVILWIFFLGGGEGSRGTLYPLHEDLHYIVYIISVNCQLLLQNNYNLSFFIKIQLLCVN